MGFMQQSPVDREVRRGMIERTHPKLSVGTHAAHGGQTPAVVYVNSIETHQQAQAVA